MLKKAQKLNPSSANLEYFVENSLAAAAYDSVWALALAYNNIMKRNRSILPEDINIEIEELSFRGTAVSLNITIVPNLYDELSLFYLHRKITALGATKLRIFPLHFLLPSF